jgi:hypothetical protein
VATERAADSREAREAARKLNVPARRAYVARRRKQERGRDSARYELAHELREQASMVIPPKTGFAVVPPLGLEGVPEVIEAANGLIDSIGHDDLMGGSGSSTKGGFVARKILPAETLELDSPYVRLALSEAVIGPTAAYLGLVPVLHQIDIWYSASGGDRPKGSQKWHMDHDDVAQMKVWIHCNDIWPQSGPLTVLDAAASEEFATLIDYDMAAGYRVKDERVEEFATSEQITILSGPKGTSVFIDTCSCFHYGSRVEQDAPARRMVMLDYMTPYSFNFYDHREQAPLRSLATSESSELERLVLGAA